MKLFEKLNGVNKGCRVISGTPTSEDIEVFLKMIKKGESDNAEADADNSDTE